MPIYEYACSSCGKSFEELVLRQRDEVEVACPRCGSREIARQMSCPAAPASSGGGSGGGCGPVG